jgi:hypothetical protein
VLKGKAAEAVLSGAMHEDNAPWRVGHPRAHVFRRYTIAPPAAEPVPAPAGPATAPAAGAPPANAAPKPPSQLVRERVSRRVPAAPLPTRPPTS